MQFSVRGAGKSVKVELPDNAPVAALLHAIEKELGISATRQRWKTGFPPKILEIPDAAAAQRGCTEAGLRHRDLITVEENATPLRELVDTGFAGTRADEGSGSTAGATAEDAPPASARSVSSGVRAIPPRLCPGATVERHVIPADNSCLFAAVLFNMGRHNTTTALTPPQLRQYCASEIEGNPCDYDALTLAECGKTSLDYAGWITKDDSWGGFLELSLLSKRFGVQIVAVDIQNVRMEYFPFISEEDVAAARPGPTSRMFVFFDGIHYDACVATTGSGSQTLFAMQDDDVVAQVVSVALALKEAKQYTNTQTFTLQCQHCFKLLVGQSDAQAHAKETGHFNFQEAP